jgi:hypothetical protein
MLQLWLPSGVERYPLPPLSRALPEIDVRGGGESVGRPNRGRLRNGVALPASEHYTIRKPYQSYGTSLTVRDVQRAIAGFRIETGFDDPLSIGAMSRRTGRRLRPHKSHQSGRDVDVRLPAMPFVEGKTLESHEVDWHATYALVEAFVRTGDVRAIYLERKFWRRLRRAAERLGADDERIAFVLGHLEHEKGHTGHIHVRFIARRTGRAAASWSGNNADVDRRDPGTDAGPMTPVLVDSNVILDVNARVRGLTATASGRSSAKSRTRFRPRCRGRRAAARWTRSRRRR